jgi:hypothetical protein
VRLAAAALAGLLAASSAAAGDEILRRVPVPSAARPQGEVRILRRDGGPVVQVVLWSRLLRRVGAEIRAKEERNWPDASSPEGAAARRYAAALEDSIEETIAEAAPPRPPRGDTLADRPRPLGVVIELVPSGERGHAAFLAPEITRGEHGLEIGRRRERRRVSLPASYLERNLRLVVADSFATTEEEAAAALDEARQ